MRRIALAACLAVTTAASVPVPVSTDDRLPVVVPESVGMSTATLREIDRALLQGLQAGGYPGAVVVVGRKECVVWRRGF